MNTVAGVATAAGGRRRGRRLLVLGVVVGAAIFSASSLPAFGADNGTVNATVTATAAACISLDKSTLDFPSLPFSTPGRPTIGGSVGSYYGVTITNCGDQNEKLFARSTDATNSGGTVTWTLDSTNTPCTAGVNKFGASINASDGRWGANLTKTDQILGNGFLLGGGQTTTSQQLVVMPCTGSSGAGQPMSWQYIYTATL